MLLKCSRAGEQRFGSFVTFRGLATLRDDFDLSKVHNYILLCLTVKNSYSYMYPGSM